MVEMISRRKIQIDVPIVTSFLPVSGDIFSDDLETIGTATLGGLLPFAATVN